MSSDGGDSPNRDLDSGGRRNFGRMKTIKQDEPERIGGGNYEGPVDDNFSKFLRNLIKERDALDQEQFPHIYRLIQSELDKASRGSYGNMAQEPVFIDLYADPPITIQAKAQPPSRQFPKFNYAGRIIGPKGAYLKALMKETSSKMVLLGKGVMKDKEKEEELRRSNDPKYLHLNEDMHVLIQVTANSSEAYKRMAYAIGCLKEQVVSDNRALETLPWIISSSGMGRPDFQRYPQSQPRSYPPLSEGPSPRSHRSAAPAPSYDYGEPPVSPVPVYRRYPHEMSPPPVHVRRSEPLKATSYGDSGQWRGLDTRDFERRSTHMRSRSPQPPPPRTSYSSASYEDPYAAYYGSADSYSYPPAADNGSYGGPMGGKMSSTRYAPYKK